MLKTIFGLIFLVLGIHPSKADTIPTNISGNNIEYAGQIIKVQRFADYISKEVETIAVDTIDEEGNFSLSYTQNETFLISVPLGIYDAILFTEPGKRYQVALPPYQPKTKADILNPFFTKVQIYLGIQPIDTLDLNYLIADFNDQYYSYIEDNYQFLYRFPKAVKIDSAINSIENKYAQSENLFFNDYRNYKYAWLKFVSYMRDSRYVVREYFHKQQFLYQNPAYMDLFNQLFTNYLSIYMNTSEGERLYSDIAFAKSPTYAKETFSNNMVLLNDTLQELVLLKGLNDAFYQHDFPFPNLLLTLDSVELTSKVALHKNIARNIRKKALQARSGYPAPGYELRDANGIFRKNTDYLANYVYLNFISLESFTCQQDMELLKILHEKHKADFKIVSICIDDDFDAMVQHFKQKDYQWILLSNRTQKSLIEDYKVKGYPSYYLINPEGNLSMSPATSPAENFELHFFRMIQSQRKSPRN